MRTTFLVGKVTRRGAEMVVVEDAGAPPIPGPWTLKALVRPAPLSRAILPLNPIQIH